MVTGLIGNTRLTATEILRSHGLTSLRAVLPWLPLEAVREEAFCMARRALPPRFFLRLFLAVTTGFSASFDTACRWKGRRLLGIDGMDMDLPRHPSVRRIFPPATNQHGARGCSRARLVGLVGLWDDVCHSFRWTSLHISSTNRLRADEKSGQSEYRYTPNLTRRP